VIFKRGNDFLGENELESYISSFDFWVVVSGEMITAEKGIHL
jgi:hypothetical protein